jgi:dipeptidyl aminopeptidase/acylaminoacyl peptidase
MPLRPAKCALTLFAVLSALVSTPNYAAPPPVEYFFETPEFTAALLSPTGRFVAVRAGKAGERQGLAVIDLTSDSIAPVIRFSDADIGKFQWISDQRLVFSTADMQAGQGDMHRAPGLFAANRDGSDLRQLVKRDSEYGIFEMTGKRQLGQEPLPWNHFLIDQHGLLDSEYVYVVNPTFDGLDQVRHVDLKRINTLTGSAQTLPRPPDTQEWLLDQKGEPRIAISAEGANRVVNYRDPATAEWRKLISYNAYVGSADGFEPIAFSPNGTLYVEATAGMDKSSIHTFNFSTGKVNPEAKIIADGYDFSGHLITNKDKTLGVRLVTDAETTVWFDARMQAVQQAVDALLPSTVNLVSVAVRPETPWVLVESYSDTTPTTFLLFNTDTKDYRKIGSMRPRIKPDQMGHQQSLRYKARDGLEIPALLTLPPGVPAQKLPLVIMVHGGPFVHGNSWGWDAETQFLASRGYAVLEPAYRGSTGFGYNHFRAGWKQWGLAMQDDLADGAKWAIAKGIADPKRICIAGASYGGYAAMMGLVNDSDLYRCGINWAGVTDINLMYTGTWTNSGDISERYRQYGMPELVGDRVKDSAQLKATSPLLQASRIRQPVLLAYGGADRRVPIHHGKLFYDAIKQSNPDVEWIMYQSEGHGWNVRENQIDFWSRVEKFLNRNIGNP